jgi:hypothetical protein
MGRTIKIATIEADWDDIVRIVASIKDGTVAPSVIMRKLAAYKRQNKLDFALAELGRIERALFTLDWLNQPALRRACQAGLNKGEARHTLAGGQIYEPPRSVHGPKPRKPGVPCVRPQTADRRDRILEHTLSRSGRAAPPHAWHRI